MNRPRAPQGIEPVSATEAPPQGKRLKNLRTGVRLTIRGRRVHLRGLRRPRAGILGWLGLLGPGVIAGAAAIDGGSIATYSLAGAKFGYDLLWLLLLLTLSMAIVQEMAARLGAATGRGLLDLIREQYGIGWTIFAVSVVLLANGGLIISEFVSISAAADLFGISKYLAVPLAAVALGYLILAGSYEFTEKVFMLMALAFLTYPLAAILAHPHWGQVAHGLFIPVFHRNPDYITLFVGLIGTAITPYQQFFQQSSVVEKGVARRHYGPERIDTYVGMALSGLMTAFIVIATGATLHAQGNTDITTAAEAAHALQPIAGNAAQELFGLGLLGASLLAGAVLPLTTAYVITEAFGFPKGVSLDFRRAPLFFGLFCGLIVLGAGVALLPNIPVIALLFLLQVFNGILLPIILVFILLLINNQHLVGPLKNSRLYNILGWGTFVLVTGAVLILLGSQLLSLLGISTP